MWRKNIFYLNHPDRASLDVESGVNVGEEAAAARRGKYKPAWVVVVNKSNLVVIFSESQQCIVFYGDRGD